MLQRPQRPQRATRSLLVAGCQLSGPAVSPYLPLLNAPAWPCPAPALPAPQEKHSDLSGLPDKACFQMNDTHPTIAGACVVAVRAPLGPWPWLPQPAWPARKPSLSVSNVCPACLPR